MTQRELILFWGVYPLLSERAATTDAVIADAVETAKAHGYVAEGDIVVVTAGSVEAGVGTTDLMKVHLVERVLAHGTGLGDRKVIGRVRRLDPPLSGDVRVEPDEIAVTPCTDRTYIPVLRRAAGLVTEEGAANAHCCLLARELGLPAVVGVQEGIGRLTDGMHIIMDAKRGLVYQRPAVLFDRWRNETGSWKVETR
jgi:pyruvate kinase